MHRILIALSMILLALALSASHAGADCTVGGRASHAYAIRLHDGNVSGYIIGSHHAHAYATWCGGMIHHHVIVSCDE